MVELRTKMVEKVNLQQGDKWFQETERKMELL